MEIEARSRTASGTGSSPFELRPDRSVGLATFAAGSFQDAQAVLAAVRGVLATWVGYTGGWVPNPSYARVQAGGTGHAEAVRVSFDPGRVSFSELLGAFWASHDATSARADAPKRSAVFVHSPEQERLARAFRSALERRLGRPLATAILPAGPFYRAEDEHQGSFERRGAAAAA
jgi:peptide-methionine (S)-S-oxide reductase